jgi:hypothetical protein
MLVFGGPAVDPNHDAVIRIGSRAPRWGTILLTALVWGHGEEKTVARRKPRKQTVGRQIEEAMRLDLKERRETPNSLGAMLEKQMVAQYGASRDTCRKARRTVLSEFIADK